MRTASETNVRKLVLYLSTSFLQRLNILIRFQVQDGQAGTWVSSSASGLNVLSYVRLGRGTDVRSCSGIHRGMGTHISRVKSVDLDAWTDEQLQSVLRWGNNRANKSVNTNLTVLEILIHPDTGSRSWHQGMFRQKRKTNIRD